MDVLEKILVEARKHNLHQTALEKKAGLHLGRISKWKKGEGEPTWKAIVALARVANVSLDYLADDAMAEPPGPILAKAEIELLNNARRLNGGAEEANRRILNYPSAPGGPTVRFKQKTPTRAARGTSGEPSSMSDGGPIPGPSKSKKVGGK